MAFKAMLWRKGVRVVSITEHADDSPTGKLMEAIIESVDEFYSENLAQEVVRGMREATSRGFWVASHVPYGYRKLMVQDGAKKRPTLEPDAATSAVVERIFGMAEVGRGILDITCTLNDEGIANPTGRLWSKNGVHIILRNESYTGTLVWGADAKDKAEPVRVEKAFPAIISKTRFRLVNRKLRSRAPKRSHPRRVGSSYLLSGLIKCKACNRALSGQDAKSGKFSYYVCQSVMKRGSGACNAPRLNARRFEELVVGKIRENVLTESNIRKLVKLVDEEMDGVAKEQRQRLETIDSELVEVEHRLDRLYNLVETTDLDIEDFKPRIRDHRERQERLEASAAEARSMLSERREVLDDVETITTYAQDLSVFLNESELTERRAFIGSFVKEIVVMPGNAVVRYTIPISQSTPKTLLLLGGRSEEFWIGNEAEASSQLVWDVEGRLYPEEQPRVELWPSQQFVFPVDVFLQSLSSTPTVRSRQHVAIGLGNPRYGNWLSLHRSRPMAKCPTAALRRRRYRARTDQQPLALLQGSRQAQSWRVRLLQRPRTAPGFQTRTPSPLMVRPQSLSLRISSFATCLSCRRS